jgi:hypothetical protein
MDDLRLIFEFFQSLTWSDSNVTFVVPWYLVMYVSNTHKFDISMHFIKFYLF